MTIYDIFNGDADGICALHQLRLAHPANSILVTGVKRDISLLAQVQAEVDDQITVLDIAMGKNREALLLALDRGAQVRYFDHHIPGDIPDHPQLTTYIDTCPNTCTSLLVNNHLNGQFLIWAVVAAFGDNMHESAIHASKTLQLTTIQLNALQQLGECINYNAYGESLQDLYFHPAELYQMMHHHRDPFTFIHEESAFKTLKNGYIADIALAQKLKPEVTNTTGAIYLLPDAPWSRRVSGVFGNLLATAFPFKAHAILTKRTNGGFVVSVRAPLATKSGADKVCEQFETGGGRKGAAGINCLPENQFDRFNQIFNTTFSHNA
ncbi:MAG: acetyltransferase [Candidatus Nitrotoga sp.]|nr:acetyltransferase [Candidatus Nitrotoga sp.]MDP1856823.1 acetyltransferase [Candidatus Nitrotoga sp.]